MHDPIDQFLAADFTGPSAPGLRGAVLAQTTRALRRRRIARRVALVGALAACFLAGMATMLAWQMQDSPKEIARVIAPEEKPLPGPLKKAAPSTRPEPPPSLVDLEWRAFDARENRAALFFAVARRYLEEQNDYESALRCYRQALDAAPKDGLAIRPDDDWLVMALKEARQKEDNDAELNP